LNLTFANDIASHPITFGIAAIMRDCMTIKERISISAVVNHTSSGYDHGQIRPAVVTNKVTSPFSLSYSSATIGYRHPKSNVVFLALNMCNNNGTIILM
jgi:hypothetical protein